MTQTQTEPRSPAEGPAGANMGGGLLARVRVILSRRTEGRGVALLMVVWVFTLLFQPLVWTSYEVTLGRISLVGLVALGLTAVILMGELDLAVASTLAVSGVIMASFDSMVVGIVAALATGLIVGAFNAFFVVVIGINSFIATLGMLFFLRGAAFVISDEQPVRISDVDAGIAFGQEIIGPLTPRMLIFVLAFVALYIFLSHVRVGREFYAVGGNRQAARDAGIPVTRRVFTGFMISGFIASLAGVINTLELTAADPTSGSTVLLASFAAAIIGGVLLNGGRGTVFGTLIGASALGMIQVALTLSGVQVDVQNIVIGSVLLLAVITDPSSLRAAAVTARALVRSRTEQQPTG